MPIILTIIRPKIRNSAISLNEERGVYTITEIALNTIDKIERAKTNFLLNLSEFTDFVVAGQQLLDISSAQSNLINEYFQTDNYEPLNDIKSEDKTFNEWYIELDNNVNKYRHLLTNSTIRKIAKNIFHINDIFMKRLKVALPTQKMDIKKKLAKRLYSLINEI